MEAHHKQYPIQRLSKALKVSRSGYYDYLKHQPGERELANEQLLEDITTVYEQSGQRYGSRLKIRKLYSLGRT